MAVSVFARNAAKNMETRRAPSFVILKIIMYCRDCSSWREVESSNLSVLLERRVFAKQCVPELCKDCLTAHFRGE